MKRIAVVAGYMIGNPMGGHVLSILHWFGGLRDLGYDVVFAESHCWAGGCWNPETQTGGDDPSYGIAELRRHQELTGLRGWCFVDAHGVYHGLSRDELRDVCRQADVLISLWTVTWLEEFMECRRRIFIDTDPGFTQFAMSPSPSHSTVGYASPLDFHEHFTYGTRIGQPDCPIPTHGIDWKPTRPPVSLDLLPMYFTPNAERFTTVMSWSSRAPILHDGVEYGQKDVEFWRVAGLPSRADAAFEIALTGKTAPRDAIAAEGWHLVYAGEVTISPWTYRQYIARSRGEFSVAVNLEVKTRSGWFSDRTAAYLASGKPVVVQDTGFSEELPCGLGLFPFSTIDDAAEAVGTIGHDYGKHCTAARLIAEEYFDARRVIADVLSPAAA
jgi:hypothetical protein